MRGVLDVAANLGCALWSAGVFWFLWWAFAEPLGAPRIGYFHAAGLALFYTFMAAVLTVTPAQLPQPGSIGRMAAARTIYLCEIAVLGALAKALMLGLGW
jgi:hypothetical protein